MLFVGSVIGSELAGIPESVGVSPIGGLLFSDAAGEATCSGLSFGWVSSDVDVLVLSVDWNLYAIVKGVLGVVEQREAW